MKIVFDIEANALVNPTKVHCIVCKDLVTGVRRCWRNVTESEDERQSFLEYASKVTLWIGHNVLSYDFPTLRVLLGFPEPDINCVIDTFIISKLVDYPRSKHSVKDYGIEFGLHKGDWTDFKTFSEEMLEYCIRDVDITEKIYLKYKRYTDDPKHARAILLEHRFQLICNGMEDRGFTLDTPKAKKLLEKVTTVLAELDKDIEEAFPPRLKFIREVTPKETKYGTIALNTIPKVLRDDISVLTVGAPFSLCVWRPFNPGSPKQVVSVLNEAGWSPEDKTDGHKEVEREYGKLNRMRKRPKELDITLQTLYTQLKNLEIYGWKVNENNLSTLPASCNPAARTLAKRILFESRRKTLTEWCVLVDPVTSRVHGEFHGIGAWTHRMAHRKPNMANITNEFDTAGNIKLLGKELRQCWRSPKGRLLAGVDAEGIQLRIFAHYVNNLELIQALLNGDKKLKTDPHSYNQRVLGNVCKSRAAAKRFLYALFLGAGNGKLAAILECSRDELEAALERLLTQYPGLAELKATIIPSDARRGWFEGIDGRKVRIPGEDVGTRKHLAMSGYLQNGEAVVMKTAAVIADPQLKQFDSFIVNIVHDEGQNETPNNMEIALEVAKIWDLAIREAGDMYNLKCPMAGSYINDHGDYTIGTNWYQTH